MGTAHLLLMFYFVNCRMFKSLVAIVIGSLMAMSAESLRVETPNRITRNDLDDLSNYCHNIAVKETLIQQRAGKTCGTQT